MGKDPPDPPDIPPDNPADVGELSPPLFTQDDSQTSRRKRAGSSSGPNHITNAPKKLITDPDSAAPSVQSVYVSPDFDKKKYGDQDAPPYIVHIQRQESDPASGTSIKAVKFGQFLAKNQFVGVKEVKSVGRNRITVEFNSGASANEFASNPLLTTSNYIANIPTHAVSRMGTIRSVPVEYSMEELVEAISVPGVQTTVIKARRFNRKVIRPGEPPIWAPTQTVVLTFSGQTLPSHIRCYYTSFPVESYILPTIQCNNCCRFGHIKAQCRAKARCFKCGQSHPGDSCHAAVSSCLHCSGLHMATDPSCPEFSRQKMIKMTMSQDNISFNEASARYPTVRRAYSEVTRQSPVRSANQSPRNSPPTHTSYVKTVFSPAKAKSPAASPGYDKTAHLGIVSSPASQLENGCAFTLQPAGASPQQEPLISPNDNLLELLASCLVSICSRIEGIDLPSNVRQILARLLPQNVSTTESNPMEL